MLENGMEEWRPISGWEGLYEVSSHGRVRSLPRPCWNGVTTYITKERLLGPFIANGYPKVGLAHPDGRRVKEYVHRLVCIAFHGPPPEGHEVAHLDGDRTNPNADNLRWATRLENIRDKAAHETQPRGEQIWMAKLTEEAVRDIRRSPESDRVAAQRYGVSRGAISAARRGRTWAHVEA